MTEVAAIDIKELRVYENGGVYHINAVSVINAPAEYVHKVLTDYVHIYHLNSSIVESHILPSPGNGAVRVRTRISHCILFFCRELDRVEDVYELPSYRLHTMLVPALSNFRSGRADWEIEPQGERCQVTYMAQMEPDFVIFPIIGPSLIKNIMHKEMVISLTKAECIAKVLQELEWNIHLQAANLDISTLCEETCDTKIGQCAQ